VECIVLYRSRFNEPSIHLYCYYTQEHQASIEPVIKIKIERVSHEERRLNTINEVNEANNARNHHGNKNPLHNLSRKW